MSLFGTSALKGASIKPDSTAANAVMSREKILIMTQAAEDAVLRPRECGAFGHELRAALAARVAHLAHDETLHAHYLALAGAQSAFADPAETGEEHGLSEVLAFVDKVANETRDVVVEDIAALQATGTSDADIVRLCELVAFLAYQLRVVSGLRLMEGAQT